MNQEGCGANVDEIEALTMFVLQEQPLDDGFGFESNHPNALALALARKTHQL